MSETCEHEGCTAEATVECVISGAWVDGNDLLVEHLCATHAVEGGYCCMCGNFWAGCESFDFSPIRGVCENCRVEFDDTWEEDEDGGLSLDAYYWRDEYADDALDYEE